MTSRHLVVSAVNLSEGGPLTVLIDSLDTAAATLGPEWKITALVHDEKLIQNPRVRAIAFPRSKRNWLSRLGLEWWKFKKLSLHLKPDLWLSLHDMTPRVKTRRQAVYCHNSSPFYKARLIEAKFDPRFFLFNKFYLYLYRLFVHRNYAVIVQQSWFRDAFQYETGHTNIVVARPARQAEPDYISIKNSPPTQLRIPTQDYPLRLFYPALPRVFKNIEILCEAIRLLPPSIFPLVDLRLTLDGTENKWAKELLNRYGSNPSISLIGRQDRSQMTTEYDNCDVVLFPSRLETWGLPIMEAKAFNKPLLVADLPYAHETVGDYSNIKFAAVDNAQPWVDAIVNMATGNWTPQVHQASEPEQPFMRDWPELWRYLASGL
ncbi:glycosyltransferase (plasmid) [Sphingomonadaceae bacterium OTU29MARTA1]|nr:glycosyltransferase [Sphingomonadaceae bacterium OTU29MARTA1]